MAKIVTMGEIMLRLSTPNNEKFIQADEFDVNYGGGEANVAVSLANYGHDVEFVTAVPANPIGDCAVAALRKYNVGTKHIARSGERLGIYFLETGSAMRASNVVYDRANSAIATATADEFNFDEIFKDADWFHFTGITPAVSDAAIELTEAALKAAKAHGVTVSVDLNFRKKLWSSEKAQKVMTNLMQYVDVCIGNEEDAEKVLDSSQATQMLPPASWSWQAMLISSIRWLISLASSISSALCVKATALPIMAGLHASWMERPVSSITPESTISLQSLTV